MFRSWLLFLVAMLLIGCQSAVIKDSRDFDEGKWTGRILFRDLKNSKSQLLHFEAQGKRNQALRLEVTATMGVPIAVFAITPENTAYLLLREKKYIVGPTTSKILSPIFTVPLDPEWLFRFLFDESLGQGWSCESDSKGLPLKCGSQNEAVEVVWKSRAAGKRMIEVKHSEAEIQLDIQSFIPQLNLDPSLFVIDAPKGFKTYRLKSSK